MKQKGSIRQWIAKHPLLYLGIVVVLIVVLSALVPVDATLFSQTMITCLWAGIVIIALFVVSPKRLQKPSASAIVWMAKKSWYVIAVAFLVGLNSFLGGVPIDLFQSVLMRLLLFLLLCIGTGLLEEGLFRGIMLDAFIENLGTRRRDLYVAAFTSSLIFGLLHVTGDVDAVISDSYALILAILKTIQAAIFGFFMAALYMRKKNLWLQALVHALYNTLIMAHQVVFFDNLPTSYVAGNVSDVIFLGFMIVLFIPLLVSGIKLINEIKSPYQTAYSE